MVSADAEGYLAALEASDWVIFDINSGDDAVRHATDAFNLLKTCKPTRGQKIKFALVRQPIFWGLLDLPSPPSELRRPSRRSRPISDFCHYLSPSATAASLHQLSKGLDGHGRSCRSAGLTQSRGTYSRDLA